MTLDEIIGAQKQSVLDGDKEAARRWARAALEEGVDPLTCIEQGFGAGIREVGSLWEEGTYFLPELVQGADAMKAAMEVLQPALIAKRQDRPLQGRVVIGTVAGDIHDIGKTLVATFLEANGFSVRDLGRDVPLEKFVETAERESADIIGLSSLLTTTMTGHREVIRMLEEKGLAGKIAVLVGGAPVTPQYAREIGAAGYGANAVDALNEAVRIMKSRGAR